MTAAAPKYRKPPVTRIPKPGPFPNGLRALRLSRELVMPAFAKQLGMTKGAYVYLEKGKGRITDARALKLAHKLGVSTAVIKGDEQPLPPLPDDAPRRREAVPATLPPEALALLGHSFDRPEAPLPLAELLVLLSAAAAVPPARWRHAVKILKALHE